MASTVDNHLAAHAIEYAAGHTMSKLPKQQIIGAFLLHSPYRQNNMLPCQSLSSHAARVKLALSAVSRFR